MAEETATVLNELAADSPIDARGEGDSVKFPQMPQAAPASSFIGLLRESMRESFGKAWAFFGALTTLLPILVAMSQRYWPEVASSGIAARWIGDNQVELSILLAAGVILAYMIYAPYKLQRDRLISTTTQLSAATEKLTRSIESRDRDSLLASIIDTVNHISSDGWVARYKTGVFGAMVTHYAQFGSEADVEWVCRELTRSWELGNVRHLDPFLGLELKYGKGAFDTRRLMLIRDARMSGKHFDTDRALDNFVDHGWAEANGLQPWPGAGAALPPTAPSLDVPKKPLFVLIDAFAGAIADGEQILARFKSADEPKPLHEEIEAWSAKLATLADGCATVQERNELQDPQIGFNETESIENMLATAQQHWDAIEKVYGKVKIARQIRARIANEQTQ